MELKGSPPKPLNTTFDNNSPQGASRQILQRHGKKENIRKCLLIESLMHLVKPVKQKFG